MKSQQKIRHWMLSATTLLLLGLFAAPALGAVDMFIKIEGIDGESKDKSHDKWIDVLSFSQGVFRPTSVDIGSSRRLGTADRTGFKINKYIDKASPKLAEACCNGKPITEVTLELIKSGGSNRTPYMKYKLTNVIVSSYHVSGASEGDPLPTEEIVLNYEAITWTYTEFDNANRPKGETSTFWDFETGTGSLVIK